MASHPETTHEPQRGNLLAFAEAGDPVTLDNSADV